MLIDLADTTALVTAAGAGIGADIARVLAGQGAAVAVTDADGGAAEDTAAGITDVPCIAQVLDVTSPDSVRAAVDAVLGSLGHIDILVNNAGVTADPDRETTWDREQDWDRTFDINCRGTVRCCQAVIPGMQRRGRGRIVNIGSMAAHAQRRTSGAYAASKAAVLRYTKGLAMALAGDGITVNAVCPGAVWTRFQEADMAAVVRDNPELADLPLEEVFERRYAEVIPLGRPQTGTDIANAVAFLASDAARNITGQCLHVDGGAVLRD